MSRTDEPFISIIVPTYHRDEQLSQCLDQLKQQCHDGSYEVIVTDDGSFTTAQNMLNQRYSWVQWVKGPGRGPAANRNNGAKSARGEWLVFTDDDCLPSENWLKNLMASAHNESIDVLEGKTLSTEPGDHPFKYYVENLNGGSYWTCNLAIRKNLFFRLGGFDEDFLEAGGEDMEFAYRLKSSAARMMFVDNAIVLHPPRSLTFNVLIWRTLLIKWSLLYQHKTGQALSLESGTLAVVSKLVLDSVVDLLRSTWHTISRLDQRRPYSNGFHQLWRWFTFPVILPYLIIWELKFRNQRKQSNNLPGYSLLSRAIRRTLAHNPDAYKLLLKLKGRGHYNNPDKAVFLSVVRRGDIVFDVGANHGYYTLLFSDIVSPSGMVHAFEPVPPTFELLQRAVGADKYTILNKLAIGNTVGDVEIHLPGTDSGQASLIAHDNGSWSNQTTVQSFKAQMMTLDKYVNNNSVDRLDFVKIDIEGAEPLALEGALQTLARLKPILYLELCNDWLSDFDCTSDDVIALLQQIGYESLYLVSNDIRKIGDAATELSAKNFHGSANLLCLIPGIHDHRIKTLPLR